MKKISLSKRERTLMIILIPLLIAGSLYQFAYLPIQKRIVTLQQEWELVKSDYDLKQARISTLPILIKNVSQEEEKIKELSNRIYGNIDQENLIVYLQDLQDQSGFKITDFDYSEASPDELLKAAIEQTTPAPAASGEGTSEAGLNEAEAGETSTASEVSDYFDTMLLKTFIIKFDTDYEHVLTLLDLINANSRTLSVNSFSLSNKSSFEENPDRHLYLMEGEMTLDFFSMGAVDAYITEEPTRLETEPLPKAGNETPFFISQ